MYFQPQKPDKGVGVSRPSELCQCYDMDPRLVSSQLLFQKQCGEGGGVAGIRRKIS